jgi:DNA-binding transcriptional regulator YiaG
MSDIASKSLAQRIKAARKKLGVSQSQAAKEWGFDLGTLQAWEQGYRNPFGLYREKLERALQQAESKPGQGSRSGSASS